MGRATAPCALALALWFVAPLAIASGVDPTKISLPKGPGSIEGLATADFSPSLATGQASYRIPIVVPPASGAFGPDLALAYDAGGGLTEVGVGWRISGVPKVRRRTEEGLPRFDANDTFELVGLGIPSPLLEVGDGVFRPSVEDGSFVRLERSPDGATWEARTKAGPILLFGGADAVEASGANVAAYLLREAHDRHGHAVSYDWDATEGHALLTHVTWNAFDPSAVNEVAFDYEPRPDVHRGFSTGIVEGLSRRLRRVTVSHGGALVRRYELSYGTETHPSLCSVQLVGSDGASRMPASQFEYTTSRLAAAAGVVTMTSPPGNTPADRDVALADLDGDALPDLLVAHAGEFISYGNADGERWLAPRRWGASSPSVSLSTTGVQLADLDADGAVDLVVKSGKDSFRYFPRPTLDNFAAPVAIRTVPGFSFEDADVRLADMDGDRRTDVIVTTESGIAVGYNLSGVDWTEPALVGAPDANESADPVRFSDGHTSLCDVNGDRVQDLCVLRSGGMDYFLGQGRGKFSNGAQASGVPAFDPASPYQLVDIDGDGWVDLVRVQASQVELALATAEGTFGEVQIVTGTPRRGPATAIEFADMDASGTTDIVWVDVSEGGAVAWRYLEPFPDGRTGLLRKIDNGLGKVQTIDYAPAARDAARARSAGAPWSSRINLAIPVVVRTTIDSTLGDPSIVTEYTYRDGTYDPVERTFAAFAGGTRRQSGDVFTPDLWTEQAFDAGLLHRELRGASTDETTRTDAGSVFSHVTRRYTSRVLATGVSGGSVAYSFQSAETTEHIEGAAEARTVSTEVEQDEFGNVTEQRSWGEVANGDPLAGHDEAITVRTYANDAAEWLLGFVTTEELSDASGKRVAFSRRNYDGEPMRGLPLGQVTRGDVSREEAWVGPGGDAFELVIATRYDSDGQPVETTDGRGGGRYFEWASDRTSIRSERVKLDGGVALVERAEVDGASGNLLAATDYGGATTHYEYDAFGRLTKVIKPGDSSRAPTVTYSYEAHAPLARVIAETRLRSGESAVDRSEVLFDGLGRKRGTLTRDDAEWILAGVTLFDARGETRRSLLPRAVTAADVDSPPLLDDRPAGADTFRDALGREVRTRSVSGIESRTVYAPLAVSHFDGGQTDGNSSYEHTPTIERKDGLGRIVEHERTLDGKPVVARYVYDAAGALRSRTDPEGNTSRYVYDGRGRRTRIDDPDHGHYELAYDATGNVVERRAPDGVTARFRFDLAGRSLTEDWDGDGTAELSRFWDIDASDPEAPLARGRLTRIVEPSGSVEHTYDARGRVTRTRYAIDGGVYAVGSEYDAQDREVRHVYPDGSSIEIRRNGRGQTVGYGNAVDFSYDAEGQETRRSLSTGVAAETKYDEERRRSELEVVAASGSVIEHLRWKYDAAGNLLSVEDRRADVASELDRSETYAYDNLYRLVGASGTWGHTGYRYSPSGNLLSRRGSGGRELASVTYGERPHLPASLGASLVQADARGRMTNDGTRDYTWNDADQLIQVSRTDGGSVKSVFGAEGVRRVRVERRADGTSSRTRFIDAWTEERDGILTRYIVHGGQRIVRLGKHGISDAASAGVPRMVSERRGPAALVVWLLVLVVLSLTRAIVRRARDVVAVLPRLRGVSLALAALCCVVACQHDTSPREGSPGRRDVHQLDARDTFIVGDLLGSVLAETTGTGEPTAAFATYPFGATRYDSSPSTWKYAASPRDGTVGLDHMGARFYAPELGVWTSADPVALTEPARLVTAEFAAANPYAYANQTPLIAADRDGHMPQLLAGALFGAAIGGGAELLSQYLEHGRIESIGKVGAAAAGGAVAGVITTACPGAAAIAIGGVGGGIARRLIESNGKSAGTLHDVIVDATASLLAQGIGKAAGTLGKAAAPKVASGLSSLGRVFRGIVGGGGEAAAERIGAAGVASDARLFQLYRADLAAQEIEGAQAVGSALKSDTYHRAASFAVEDIRAEGKVFTIAGRSGPANLTQVGGEVNGAPGRFEWLVDSPGNLTHQMFVPGGTINGIPIAP
jgi:RHS repeat-associated protein